MLNNYQRYGIMECTKLEKDENIKIDLQINDEKSQEKDNIGD